MIIIFGAAVRPDGSPSGAMRGRVQAALACAASLRDPDFMPTGGQGRHGPPEAEVMAGQLLREGVKAERIRPVPKGANTIRSAIACAQALRGSDRPVHVATSAYHLARCVILLRIAGLRVLPCRPPPAPASTNQKKRWFWRLRELAAVPVDSVLMLYFRLRGRL